MMESVVRRNNKNYFVITDLDKLETSVYPELLTHHRGHLMLSGVPDLDNPVDFLFRTYDTLTEASLAHWAVRNRTYCTSMLYPCIELHLCNIGPYPDINLCNC